MQSKYRFLRCSVARFPIAGQPLVSARRIASSGLPTIRPPRVMYHLALRNSKYPTTNAGMANNPRASYKPPRS